METIVDLRAYNVPEHWEPVLRVGFHGAADFPGDVPFEVLVPHGWLHDGTFTAVDKLEDKYKVAQTDKTVPKQQSGPKPEDFVPSELAGLLMFVVNKNYRSVSGQDLPALAYQGSLNEFTEYLSQAAVYNKAIGIREGLSTLAGAINKVVDSTLNPKK